MAVILHRGKVIPIIGHRNGSPVSVPRDGAGTAISPLRPSIRGGIDMAAVAAGATHHRGKFLPIIGHRNGKPVFIARDSRASCRTAVRPISPQVRGGVDMAVIRHRGKVLPIRGHRDGCPVFVARDSAGARSSYLLRSVQAAPEFEEV